MKHNSSHKANSVVFWFLWAVLADGISSIPSALAKSQLFISICLFLISTMGTIYSNCSSQSNNYCKIPFVVKFNVYLLNNNLQISFFSLQPDTETSQKNFLHKLPKTDPCSVTKRSSFLIFWVSLVRCLLSAIPYYSWTQLVMQRSLGPHLSLRLRKESLELALHLLSNRDDSPGDICLPPSFPQPGSDFPQPWRPICLSSKAETIPLCMPLLNLRGTVPFLACSLLKEGKQRSQNEWSLIFLGRFAFFIQNKDRCQQSLSLLFLEDGREDQTSKGDRGDYLS